VDTNVDGDTFYIDFERIKKHGGYVYYWHLSDYLKPIESRTLSFKRYNQGDCLKFRFKVLSFSYHKEPMGKGDGKVFEPQSEDLKDWQYPPPYSSNEEILKSVCQYASSFASWKKVGVDIEGSTYYVDLDSIRKHGEYVYFLSLGDWLEPVEFEGQGIFSTTGYHLGDCKNFEMKWLGGLFHTKPMGEDVGEFVPQTKFKGSWEYPPPDSIKETILKFVCQYAR
jgi:hypothetical protein